MNQNLFVNVSYANSLKTSDLTDIVAGMESPHTIMWYIGAYGPKKEGIDFYKAQIIQKILLKASNPTLHLVDLTAWAAFKNPFCSINRTCNLMKFIKKLSHPNIHGISSADIFQKLISLHSKELEEHFKEVLKRDSLYRLSKEYPATGISLGQIIQTQNTLLDFIVDKDTNAVYAPLQYLEGCILVGEIYRKYIHKKKNIQIVFALPNNEADYYKDDQNSFAKDIQFLISNQFPLIGESQVAIDILFLSFKYGSFKESRPYNAPGPILSKDEFSLATLIGIENL